MNTPRAAAPGRRAAAGAAAASQSCADPDQATPERWGNGAASVEGAVSHTKLLDCKSCDQILCLTKKMAAELLPPPIAATTTGAPPARRHMMACFACRFHTRCLQNVRDGLTLAESFIVT